MSGTFQGFPQWYSDYIRALADRANRQVEAPYQLYEGKRFAPLTDLQEAGREAAVRAKPNGDLRHLAHTNLERATDKNVSASLAPRLDQALQPSYSKIDKYMNPYQNAVVNRIGELGARNLSERLLPAVNTTFTGAGQFGSSRHRDFTNRALRDTQESTLAQQNQALTHGYDSALRAAESDKQRELAGAQVAAGTEERDRARLLLGTRAAQDLGRGEQEGQLRYADTLGQLGYQQQQINQQDYDRAYHDFLEQREYPRNQTLESSNILRGLNVPRTQINRQATPLPQQPSSTSQFAGLLGGLLGGINMAEGGSVNASALTRGADEAKRAARREQLRDSADELTQSPQMNRDRGLWEMLARTGFGMAASQNPNALGAFGEGALGGLDAIKASRAEAAANRMKGFGLHNDLDQQEVKPQQELEKLMLQNLGKQELQQLKGNQGEELAAYRHELEQSKPLNKVNKDLEFAYGILNSPEATEEDKETAQEIISNASMISQAKNAGRGTNVNVSGQEKAESSEIGKAYGEKFKEIQARGQGAQDTLQKLRVVKNSLDKAKPGPGFDIRETIAGTIDALGGDSEKLGIGNATDMTVVRKYLNDFVIDKLATQKGVQSDRDMEFIGKTLAQPTLSKNQISGLLDKMEKIEERAKEKSSAASSWVRKYKGLSGIDNQGKDFEQTWDEYVNSEPLFVDTSTIKEEE